MQTIAELFESQTADLDKAMQHYEQAAEYFRGEESHSSANKCMLKVAEYSATLEQYEKAIKIYEQVAAASLENQLLKYAAKEQFFRASICHLCIDALNAQHAVQKYEEQYPAFGDSRECKLIKVKLYVFFCFREWYKYFSNQLLKTHILFHYRIV